MSSFIKEISTAINGSLLLSHQVLQPARNLDVSGL
jgi:hypothetical protein